MATHRARPSPGRRVSLLVSTAALGAIACSLIAPSGQAAADTVDINNRQAALILAEESAGGAASRGEFRTTVETMDSSAPAAIAAAQAQARAQALDDAAAAAAQAAADPAASLPATPDGYRAYALGKVGAAQFACLNPLWERESHWRAEARNPSSTAYGIPQLLDSTWRYTGVVKTSNGFRQVDAGLAYLRRAYGDPCTAWAHEQSRGWY